MCNNILVVDSQDNLMFTQQIINSALPEINVISLHDSAEVMDYLKNADVCLVLADFQISQLNGIELCKLIKEDEDTAHIPVIIITSLAVSPEVKSKGLNWGADDFISRPIDTVELISRIKTSMRIYLAEKELRSKVKDIQSEYKHLFEAMNSGCATHEMLFDSSGKACDYRFISINPAFEKMTTMTEEMIIGKTVREVIPNIEEIWIERYAEVVSTGVPINFQDYSAPLDKHFEVSAFKLNNNDFGVIFSDVSARIKSEIERKKLEEQLQHSQKMESIGLLSAGIAHEINTPIQFVGDNNHFLHDSYTSIKKLISLYQKLGDTCVEHENCSALLSEIEEFEELNDLEFLLEEIPEAISQNQSGINRIAGIVKALKRFSHPGGHTAAMADVNEIINNTLIITRNELKHVADVKTDLEGTLPQTLLHENDFSQVILNLLINASHAIKDVSGEERGEIKITTCSTDSDIKIKIKDSGIGIKPENHSKIFTPFFTTKGVGTGTGQGLSMAYSVITEKHKGAIHFDSEIGKGTTFTISIPRNKTCK